MSASSSLSLRLQSASRRSAVCKKASVSGSPVAFFSFFDYVILREKEHRLEPTDEEALLHAAAFLEELYVLEQRTVDVIQDLLSQWVV